MTTRVLLCGDRVAPFDTAGWIPDVDVTVVAELCHQAKTVGRLARGASRLVVGVCPNDYSLGSLQTEARRAGLDALGVEIVDLRAADGDPRRLQLIVAGTVARAAAFSGSRPEQAKLVLPKARSRRSLFSLGRPEYLATPGLAESSCAAPLGCSACVGACPRGALVWAEGKVELDVSACDACGMCIAACPTGAITDPAGTPAQLAAQVRALLDTGVGPPGPRGVLYTCRQGTRGDVPAGWYPVTVPCTAMVPAAWLLAPLLMGAAATGVRPCGESGCHLGNDAGAVGQVAFCRDALGWLGLDAEHVTIGPQSAPVTEGWRSSLPDPFATTSIAAILTEFLEFSGLGPEAVLEHPASPLGRIRIDRDVCTACAMCAQGCPTMALGWEQREDAVEVNLDAALCLACGQCLARCPEAGRGAMELTRVLDVAAVRRGRHALVRGGNVRCEKCGQPVASEKMLTRIRDLLGQENAATMDVITRYCLDCRGGPLPSLHRPGGPPAS